MLTELAQIQKEEEMKEKAKESVINNLYITALCAAASGENDTEKLLRLAR
jgi:hypothetical protein